MEHKDKYERRDANIPMVVGGGILTAVILFGAIAAMYWFFAAEYNQQPKSDSPFADQRTLPPAPRLQATPYEDMKQYSERAAAELSSYGWVDKQQGVVRIPIGRAMEMVIERGIPGRQPGDSSPPPLKPAAASQQAPAAAKE